MESGYLEKKGFINGLAITAALIIFFFLMKALGLIHHYELRGFNAVIMFSGVFLAIRSFKRRYEEDFSYYKKADPVIADGITPNPGKATFTFVPGQIL